MKTTWCMVVSLVLSLSSASAAELPTGKDVARLYGTFEKALAKLADAKNKKTEYFDPAELHEISKRGIGLPPEQAFDAIQKALTERYGDRIAQGRHWIINDAGGALGQLTLMYCSPKEYIIFFGSPLAINGHSGRYPNVEFWDFVFTGVMRTFHEGETHSNTYPPGTFGHLERGQVKGYDTDGGTWMLEYGRGNILSAFDFGVVSPARYVTRDWHSAWSQIKDCGRLAIHEIFGKGSKEAVRWEQE